jgi:hypothetical protein
MNAGRKRPASVERDPATARAGDWSGVGLFDASRDLYPRSKPRRKHSRDGSVRCPICAPLRCSRAP